MPGLTENDPAHPITTPASTLAAGSPRKSSLWLLLRVWLALGLQSFGGGAATLFLIRRAAVERYRWISDEEFTRDWSLCLITPGINLLCMTILVGRRVAGLAGAIVALVGLMLPSVTITVLMTALYAQLQSMAAIQAALRGVVPATVGLGLLLSAGMARPLLAASRREGRMSMSVSVALLLGSATIAAFWRPPVIAVLCGAGAIGALALWWRAARGARQP